MLLHGLTASRCKRGSRIYQLEAIAVTRKKTSTWHLAFGTYQLPQTSRGQMLIAKCQVLFPILCRLWPLFQHLAIPYRAFASVIGQFEILGQLQRVGGTGVLAQPAEHAAA